MEELMDERRLSKQGNQVYRLRENLEVGIRKAMSKGNLLYLMNGLIETDDVQEFDSKEKLISSGDFWIFVDPWEYY